MKQGLQLLAALVLVLGVLRQASAGPMQIKVKNAKATYAYSYSYNAGSNIVVGYYADQQGTTHGYLYDTGTGTATTINAENTQGQQAGNTTAYTYDALDRQVVGTYTDSSGTHGYTYDTGTNSTTTIDVGNGGNTTAYSYDALDREVVGSYTDTQGNTHGYTYDTQSRATTTIDAQDTNNNPATTTYTYETFYDSLNRQQAVGTYTDQNGHTHGYTYDIQGRATTTIDVPGASSTTAYYYDALDRAVIGSYTDSSGTHGYSYDIQSRKFEEIDPFGARDTTYSYYDDGRRIVGTYTDQQGNTYGYVDPIPEPSSLVLLSVGAACLAGSLARRRQAACPHPG